LQLKLKTIHAFQTRKTKPKKVPFPNHPCFTTDRTRDTFPPLAKLINRIRVEDKITKFVAKMDAFASSNSLVLWILDCKLTLGFMELHNNMPLSKPYI
jgi:hypothetical protein